jgi:uncharacterized membrane protein YedE/YeeE
MLAAIRAATQEQFGARALAVSQTTESAENAPLSDAVPDAALLPDAVPKAPARLYNHLLFFVSLIVGGAIAHWSFDGAPPVSGLRSQELSQLLGGNSAMLFVVLLLGGAMVGFGTRMAGGCTSGHGLCGVSRLQKGSLLATLAFFGAAVVTSFLLGAL